MHILLTNRPPAAFGYISDGWQNSLRAAGHICERWDGRLDSWCGFAPDLAIGVSGHRQPIPEPGSKARSNCKVAIHVNPYGDVNLGVNEPEEAIRWVLNQKPDVVFGYGHQTDAHYWKHWYQRHNIPWAPMPTAGDTLVYRKTETARIYDIAYVGGYWPYKAKNLDRYLTPLLRDKDLKSIVYGWGHWPRDVCNGSIEDPDVAKLLNQSKIAPCVAEPHTSEFGIDLPERLFKAALCGALIIHDRVIGLERYVPSAIIAKNPEEFKSLCKYWAQKEQEKERLELAEKQRLEVLRSNTYFDRIATLFMGIGETKDDSNFKNEALKMAIAKLEQMS